MVTSGVRRKTYDTKKEILSKASTDFKQLHDSFTIAHTALRSLSLKTSAISLWHLQSYVPLLLCTIFATNWQGMVNQIELNMYPSIKKSTSVLLKNSASIWIHAFWSALVAVRPLTAHASLCIIILASWSLGSISGDFYDLRQICLSTLLFKQCQDLNGNLQRSLTAHVRKTSRCVEHIVVLERSSHYSLVSISIVTYPVSSRLTPLKSFAIPIFFFQWFVARFFVHPFPLRFRMQCFDKSVSRVPVGMLWQQILAPGISSRKG